MPWCPDCKLEYEPATSRCTVCGAGLVASLTEQELAEPVVVRIARFQWEALALVDQLLVEGIRAFERGSGPAALSASLCDSWEILVPRRDAKLAVELLGEVVGDG